jgi:hypothetical protein
MLRPEPHAIGLGAPDAFGGAFLDEIALELSDGGEHMEQQASGRARRVDGLIQHHEVDPFPLQRSGDVEEVGNRARQAVETGHQKDVAFTDELQSVRQLLAFLAAGAASLLLEQLLAAGKLQALKLYREALPGRTDAGVSDLHVAQGLRE